MCNERENQLNEHFDKLSKGRGCASSNASSPPLTEEFALDALIKSAGYLGPEGAKQVVDGLRKQGITLIHRPPAQQ